MIISLIIGGLTIVGLWKGIELIDAQKRKIEKEGGNPTTKAAIKRIFK